MQFTVIQVTVQHSVNGIMTYTFLIMPIRIIIPSLILATLTLLQMELQTVIQSWLEPITSHLTKLRYFISLESCNPLDFHPLKPFEIKEIYTPPKNEFNTYCKVASIRMTQLFEYYKVGMDLKIRGRRKRRLKTELAFFQCSSTLSNVGDPSWRWISKYYAQVQEKKANLFVAYLRPPLNR